MLKFVVVWQVAHSAAVVALCYGKPWLAGADASGTKKVHGNTVYRETMFYAGTCMEKAHDNIGMAPTCMYNNQA